MITTTQEKKKFFQNSNPDEFKQILVNLNSPDKFRINFKNYFNFIYFGLFFCVLIFGSVLVNVLSLPLFLANSIRTRLIFIILI
jgi:hypothetical protein